MREEAEVHSGTMRRANPERRNNLGDNGDKAVAKNKMAERTGTTSAVYVTDIKANMVLKCRSYSHTYSSSSVLPDSTRDELARP